HAQGRHVLPPEPRRRNRLADQFRGEGGRFVPETGTNPGTGPEVLNVSRERPGRHPGGVRTGGQKHEAPAGRYELPPARLLPVVVAVGQGKRSAVGTVRQVPVHLLLTRTPLLGTPASRS